MASSQPAARHEGDGLFLMGLRRSHTFILNRSWILNRTQQFTSGSRSMPIFEYVCKECRHQFEALVYAQEKAVCPKGESKTLEPKLSVFAVSAKAGSSSMPAGPMPSG